MTIDLDRLVYLSRLVREAERKHRWLRQTYSLYDPRYERCWKKLYARIERRRLTYYRAIGYSEEEIADGIR